MYLVYRLRDDFDYIVSVQNATRNSREFGFEPTDGLFGSAEWWAHVESGKFPKHTLRGYISGVYWGGNYPEFELTSWHGERSRWRRRTHSRAEDALYEVGRTAELDYVVQRHRLAAWDGGAKINVPLEIWIGDAAPRVLEDVLAPNLRLVVCGTAAGEVPAACGEYYAGRGNKFWPTLHEVGLTPRRLAPQEFRELLVFDIGLTNVVQGQAGSDEIIDLVLAKPESVRAKIVRTCPLVLAFNGKKAAELFLGARHVHYGLQPAFVGSTKLFVAPSTSGAANGYWNIDGWRELARLVGGATT